MSKLLKQLNDKQREAVIQTEGPVLIIAGAGSGKTRALTHRVAYLVKEKRIPPKNILAVTFTNKAAGEMADRVKELLGLPKTIPPYSQYLPHIGTFHAICVKILRREIEKIGYKKSFVIYDDQDQLALIRRVCKDLGISPDQIKPQAILGTISSAKNKLIDAKMFERQMGSWFEELVAKAYNKYQSELKKADALDFDDIILLTVKLFQKYPDVLNNYQDLFRYIMVDEYQDTNFAQYTLLKLLSQKYQNICVVGDDWQSIYQWRGADVQNILDFEKDYPSAKVVMLEQNYRSTQNILDAAYCVISKNINRKDKKLWTENLEGHLLTSYEARDEKDEAQFVVREIKKFQKEEKMKLDNFAVLYRTNAQSRALEEAFMKAAIPYKIIGGVKFYQRKEIKDILAYLFLIQNPSDTVSFERVANVPVRGIGQKTIAKIIQMAEGLKLDPISAIELLEENKAAIQAGKIKTLQSFSKLIRSSQKYARTHKVSQLISEVYAKSGYEAMLAAQKEEGLVRHENIQELLTVAKKYDSATEDPILNLQQFLEEVALVSQTDRDLESNEAVPLMTLHSAKGLEFDVIFIVGMEEGLLPHSRATLNEKEMEEERRLCYVGITRAKKKAFLLFTTARNIYGTTQISIKSRFLDEIDENLLDYIYTEDIEYTAWEDDIIELDDEDFENSKEKDGVFEDGDHVEHPQFGKGIVISQDENLITVAFPQIGLKKLAKTVAPLKKI